MKRDDYLTIRSLNYPVYIGLNLWDTIGNLTRPYSEKGKSFILTDHNTEKYCLPGLLKNVPSLNNSPAYSVIPGESAKDIRVVEMTWNWLMNSGADRDSLLINLGGGVISDMGGFAAATFKRGMKFLNIPTSLIGQADAATGGKTGINFSGIKNHVGLFANPLAVFIIPGFLESLPADHLRSGFAEIVKCAILAGNGFWNNVKKTGLKDWKTMDGLIAESVKFKADVVARDQFDHSFRKVLNFGHTIGHALESFYYMPRRNRILHGDAIASGMICSAFISAEMSGLSNKMRDEIVTFIKDNFPLHYLEEDHFEKILSFMDHDKKSIGLGYNFSLLKSIGEPVFDRPAEREQVIGSLKYLNQICRQ